MKIYIIQKKERNSSRSNRIRKKRRTIERNLDFQASFGIKFDELLIEHENSKMN
jgi:hypothetical protein